MGIDLYPHQIKAFNEIHNGCVVKGGVGTGKTRTSLAYVYFKELGGSLPINGKGSYAPISRPMDIYVITTAKKRESLDWEDEAKDFALTREREHSEGGVQFLVDSWNNIVKYQDVTGAFFIFDEQRLVGSGAWVKAFLKLAKNNRWIMLSATPGDTWMDYVPIFMANGWFRTRSEFLENHVQYESYTKFPKVKRYLNTGILERYRARVLVEMPYARHTVRRPQTINVEYDKEAFERVQKDRWHIFEDRPLKDVAELFAVMRKVSNSDPSRLGAVMMLTERHPKLIVFYNFNYELEALRTLGTTLDIPVAEWNGQKHQEIPKTDKWLYLVQYSAGSEGWNCIETDAIAFYSLNYSWRITEQSQGRTDRLNTPFVDLHYYFLRNGSFIDQAIWRALNDKKQFNEKAASKPWKDMFTQETATTS